jgi:DNA gyrase/topoisomerase IV subunit A
MTPWIRNFSGQILPKEGNYTTYGDFKITGNQMEITELPWRVWTRDYKTFLEGLVQSDEIEDLREHHRDNQISFRFTVFNLQTYLKKEGQSALIKRFKLSKDISCNNMVLFV